MSSHHQIVIVGGGSAGIATAASLLHRRQGLDIAIVEPSEDHYYQPGWTMVGGGVFDKEFTHRKTEQVMPKGVDWHKAKVATFQPDQNRVTLEDGSTLSYDYLVVAAGILLDWGKIDGLEATLGRNGVTSNYRYDVAPYTWQLANELSSGTAIFTQPPMPIKCAGAPQKAMYLTCSQFEKRGVLKDIDVQFHNAGPVLFGVADYVPALMEYVERYGIDLQFGSTLVAVDGDRKEATFRSEAGDTVRKFDMLHVTPFQRAPEFIANSPLAAESGYVEVDDATLRHKRYGNVFALGDCGSMPNAKTAAAARKQAPIAAVNLLAVMDGREPKAAYDGYGSCPLTVEHGKIVLAEFGYGGKLLPTFPDWLIKGTRPRRLSWKLKADVLPWVYWNGMLKGHEWLVEPE